MEENLDRHADQSGERWVRLCLTGGRRFSAATPPSAPYGLKHKIPSCATVGESRWEMSKLQSSLARRLHARQRVAPLKQKIPILDADNPASRADIQFAGFDLSMTTAPPFITHLTLLITTSISVSGSPSNATMSA